MKGIYANATSPILQLAGNLQTDPGEVAEGLAAHYSSVSSFERYPPQFQAQRLRAEKSHLNFHSQQSLSYNVPFAFNELTQTMQTCRDSAPGCDGIT